MPPEDPPINGVAAAAAASESASSPRVSSIASGTEGKPRQDGPSGIVDPAAPGMDTHHWAGVRHGHRDIDARSVASSMAAEKDALSVNEHQDGGVQSVFCCYGVVYVSILQSASNFERAHRCR